jgi:NAD(P)-dependent dehydrogenase (short-subunit alcohol dehydrogenase family)
VLVGNAALIINKPFEAFSILEYEEQLRINAGATFALARALAPGMKARREGSIVSLTSVTLNGRWDGYVPYVASKGAVFGLTKALARELGPFNVRVNAVSPAPSCQRQRTGSSAIALRRTTLGSRTIKVSRHGSSPKTSPSSLRSSPPSAPA